MNYDFNQHQIEILKDKIKKLKSDAKIKKLEAELSVMVCNNTKQDWKSNFVSFVNKYIMKTYRVANEFPSMGNNIFIDRVEFDKENIMGYIGNRFFFTYLEGTRTVMVVFESEVMEIQSQDKSKKCAIPCYKVKTVEFGVLGFPVTKTAKFYLINGIDYKNNELVENPLYKQLEEKQNNICSSKEKYKEYLKK